jgi:hypothetical protein
MVLLFTVGLIASRVWPAYEHLLGLAFYIWLGALAIYVVVITLRVRRQPTNYRSLRLSDTSLECEPLQNQRFSMDWQGIESAVFCREEAVFPDPGPYLETKWFITRQGSEQIEVMDEWDIVRLSCAHFASACRASTSPKPSAVCGPEKKDDGRASESAD